MAHDGLPEFREWSIAAVHLLQGVVYEDSPRVWDVMLASRSQLENYFARLGLLLVVDEPEGLAYLRHSFISIPKAEPRNSTASLKTNAR